MQHIRGYFNSRSIAFPLTRTFLFISLLTASLPFFGRSTSPFAFTLLRSRIINGKQCFLLQVSCHMETILQHIIQQISLHVKHFLQLLHGIPELLLQLFIIRSYRTRHHRIQRLQLLLKISGGRVYAPLQSPVGCIVLRSINQAGILDTELLGYFRHFVVKTFHFLLTGCELLGKELVQVFVYQPHIPPQSLLHGLEIEQARQQFQEIGLLQGTEAFLVRLVSPCLHREGIYCMVTDNGLCRKRGTEHHSLQCLAAAQSHIGLPMRKGGTGINHGTFKRQSLAFVNGNRPRQLQRILPECSFNIFCNLLGFLIKHVFGIRPLFLLK